MVVGIAFIGICFGHVVDDSLAEEVGIGVLGG